MYIVKSGVGQLTIQHKRRLLKEGDAFTIPLGEFLYILHIHLYRVFSEFHVLSNGELCYGEGSTFRYVALKDIAQQMQVLLNIIERDLHFYYAVNY